MSREKKNDMYESESGSEKSPQDHDIHNPNKRKHTLSLNNRSQRKVLKINKNQIMAVLMRSSGKLMTTFI